MLKAIIFDADNTLYKTNEVAADADFAAMEFFAKQKGLDSDTLFKEWGRIVEEIKNLKNPGQRTRHYSYGRLAEKYKLKDVEGAYKAFLGRLLEKLEPVDGLNLEKLKKFKLIIITEEERSLAMAKIQKIGIDNFFCRIVTSTDAGVMKPNEKYFDVVLKDLDLKPEECVVVGDIFDKDLEIPKKMGMKVILFDGEDERADFCIHKFEQLFPIVNSL